VTIFLEYYTEALPDYPLDAKIPFSYTSHRMFCPNAINCGILANKEDRVDAPWHLCPAHATLRQLKPLPETHEVAVGESSL
jgi:hypothetical protein